VADVPNTVAWEVRTQRDDYVGYQRIIQGNLGRIGFGVAGSAADPGWEWSELSLIANTQAVRIREVSE
jgi:hypothetical protein